MISKLSFEELTTRRCLAPGGAGRLRLIICKFSFEEFTTRRCLTPGGAGRARLRLLSLLLDDE